MSTDSPALARSKAIGADVEQLVCASLEIEAVMSRLPWSISSLAPAVENAGRGGQ